MFCSKCGTKNDEGAKFCSKCGEPLTEETKKTEETTSQTPIPNSTNPGGIRKAMKADARKKVNGSLVGATALYLLIAVVIVMIFGESSFTVNGNSFEVRTLAMSPVENILVGLLGLVFGLGILMVGFNAVRGQEYKWTDVFTRPFNHLDRLGYMLLLTVIVIAICFVAELLMIIPFLGFLVFIALIVAMIYYIPALEMFGLILADTENNKEIKFADTVKKALEITKGHRVEFYGVTFSFIGWLLLAPFTLFILCIWLIPYMELTYNNLYRRWINEENFENTDTGLSNEAVIGITAGGMGCGCLLIVVVFTSVIAAITMFIGVGNNNPEIQKWIDENIPAEDRASINADWNDIMNDLNEYN